jgi:hypothetical protein
MSSYDSNKSGYLHPQYQQQQQQQQQQPPYPTTPAPAQQPQNYFPPIPEQQPVYSSSPTQPFYSSSPTSPRGGMAMMPQPQVGHRRTSSSSSYNSQQPTQFHPHSIPIPIRQPVPQNFQHAASYPPPVTYAQQQPVYARSMSQQSNPYAYADGEGKYEGHHYYGELDPETEREYKRRYAKDKEFERRPTLGGSLLSMVGKVGRAFGSSERR